MALSPDTMLDSFLELMQRGGVVMWPLLVMSLVSVTLAFERCWFFMASNRPGRLERVDRMASLLRRGDRDAARRLAAGEPGVYANAALRMLDESPLSEAAAVEAVESQRRRLERFMPTLSSIITAAPMLGILGTVLGIISSFEVLSDATAMTDPRAVSQGIAEALITTAAGLIVALVTLFPYNAFRAQIDRMLSRFESLATAAVQGAAKGDAETGTPPKPVDSHGRG